MGFNSASKGLIIALMLLLLLLLLLLLMHFIIISKHTYYCSEQCECNNVKILKFWNFNAFGIYL
jgi:hypothetical protein